LSNNIHTRFVSLKWDWTIWSWIWVRECWLIGCCWLLLFVVVECWLKVWKWRSFDLQQLIYPYNNGIWHQTAPHNLLWRQTTPSWSSHDIRFWHNTFYCDVKPLLHDLIMTLEFRPIHAILRSLGNAFIGDNYCIWLQYPTPLWLWMEDTVRNIGRNMG